jgi:succinate dehydrogenase/fumarate reductase-like Fe-S protein
MERLHALAILAWAFLKTLLAPLFGERRGLAAFQKSYGRLLPVSQAERDALPSFGRCIACGRCNIGEASRIVASKGAYGGVMDLMLASSRSMPDYDAAARSFASVDEAHLAELEQVCPTGVPMRRIRLFVLDKARELEQHVA